ncbi:MAG TPA: hypothetical protein VFG76_13425 [Candidatus Polarisedimenticolia bacterium]|nr:hypothetical protein [Candidatus Polarisedimenticolia bacterium]
MNDPTSSMMSVGEFLTECGSRLAFFERARVGRMGCASGLLAAAVSGLALALGWKSADGIMAGFRFIILCALGLVLFVFVLTAAFETVVERSLKRRIRDYIEQGGADAATLLAAADVRKTHIPGGLRLVALLKEMQTGP